LAHSADAVRGSLAHASHQRARPFSPSLWETTAITQCGASIHLRLLALDNDVSDIGSWCSASHRVAREMVMMRQTSLSPQRTTCCASDWPTVCGAYKRCACRGRPKPSASAHQHSLSRQRLQNTDAPVATGIQHRMRVLKASSAEHAGAPQTSIWCLTQLAPSFPSQPTRRTWDGQDSSLGTRRESPRQTTAVPAAFSH